MLTVLCKAGLVPDSPVLDIHVQYFGHILSGTQLLAMSSSATNNAYIGFLRWVDKV